jgi:hypothetical protein
MDFGKRCGDLIRSDASRSLKFDDAAHRKLGRNSSAFRGTGSVGIAAMTTQQASPGANEPA